MGEFQNISVTLQSGKVVSVDAWPGSDAAQPVVIVAPGTTADDWSEFSSLIVASRAPLLAKVSSAFELVMLIWEIGEPVLLLSQGDDAAGWVSEAVKVRSKAHTALSTGFNHMPHGLIQIF